MYYTYTTFHLALPLCAILYVLRGKMQFNIQIKTSAARYTFFTLGHFPIFEKHDLVNVQKDYYHHPIASTYTVAYSKWLTKMFLFSSGLT